MRLCYLAADRMELQFAAKELARQMASPTLTDQEALKSCVRFILKHLRAVQRYTRQTEIPKQLICYSDTDQAGCLRTRRSTSSIKVFFGRHLLRSTSTTQVVVIALSIGESEFYSAVKAASSGTGTIAMMRDLGLDLEQPLEVRTRGEPSLEIRCDAIAGLGIAMRRGAGHFRHIATPTLWLQKMVCDLR